MEALASLTYYMVAISIVILVIIVAGVAYVSIFHRKKPGDDKEPYQNFGNLGLEITWTLIPCGIVAILFLLTCNTLREINPPVADREPDLIIIGHQWWWEFRYPDSGIITANELHIPVNTMLLARVESVDVIHDFWIPELGPKIDAVPGHPNHLWINAGETGVFLGACAEFCGVQHANMRIRVVSQTDEDFKEWEQEQLKVPPTPGSGLAGEGAQLFIEKACMNCHAINGTAAAARIGPNLTHLADRQTIGAGVLTNTPENLNKWLTDPQRYKQGSLMPDMKLSPDEVDAIVAYLEALK